jgi:hypothetical protein
VPLAAIIARRAVHGMRAGSCNTTGAPHEVVGREAERVRECVDTHNRLDQ